MRWHCSAKCTWLGLAASGRVVGFAPWARHGPRRRQGPNSRLPGAHLAPGTGRQIADISRAPGLISDNRGDAAGSAPQTHAATGHRTYQKVDGSSLKLYVVRVFEAGRQQNFKKSSVWRPARPKRSGNVGVRHVPTKQNDYGGSWCQNSSLKFWPPGTELWPARVQNKQKKVHLECPPGAPGALEWSQVVPKHIPG